MYFNGLKKKYIFVDGYQIIMEVLIRLFHFRSSIGLDLDNCVVSIG